MRFTKKDWAYLIVPIILWWGAFQVRPEIADLRCGQENHDCVQAEVPWPDSLVIGLKSESAHVWSFVTQDLTAALAIGGLFIANRSLGLPWIEFGKDLLLLGQMVLFNGSLNEWVRTLVQRPRPHVYGDPEFSGLNPAHYTSFYSGHSSFAALMAMGGFLLLLYRRVPRRWALLFMGASTLLTFSTGLLRILAGRHFITDVLAAWLAGGLISILVIRLHRSREGLSSSSPSVH